MALTSYLPEPEDLSKSLNASDISKILARHDGLFNWFKNFVVVPNLSHSLLTWEADLVACTKSGYLSEVEIKVSASDWKNDHLKSKWRPTRDGGRPLGWRLIKNFYYAAPVKLAKRYQEFEIPDYAGIIAVSRTDHGSYIADSLEFLRPAKAIPGHRKLTDKEMTLLARMGAMRIWKQ